MNYPTLYPPLGNVPYTISQGPHGTNHAQDLDTANDAAPIYAPCAGTVDDIQFDPDCGLSLHITRADGLRITLCHLSQKLVTSGTVRVGQRVGTMGSTGHSTGPHLHWACRWQGVDTYPGFFPLSLSLGGNEMVIGRTPDGTRIVRVSDFVKHLTQGTVILDSPDGLPIATLAKDAAVEFYGESEDRKWHQVEIGSPRYPGPVLGWVPVTPGLVQRKPAPPDDVAALQKRLAAKDVALGTVIKAGKEGLAV